MSPLIESIKCYFMPKTNLASSGEPPASQNHFNHWWRGTSYSICIPSLKFVDLPVPKIMLIFGHSVNRPGDLDLSTSK